MMVKVAALPREKKRHEERRRGRRAEEAIVA
jgi:hypothetical protein